MTRPECECTGPGWCERHKVRKSPHMWKLCQTRQDYFLMWEAGRGPGQHIGGVAELAKAECGVGTELRKMLGCTCRIPIARWDEWGPERCLAAFDAIVSDIIERSAKSRQPVGREAAERFLRIAIERVAT